MNTLKVFLNVGKQFLSLKYFARMKLDVNKKDWLAVYRLSSYAQLFNQSFLWALRAHAVRFRTSTSMKLFPPYLTACFSSLKHEICLMSQRDKFYPNCYTEDYQLNFRECFTEKNSI